MSVILWELLEGHGGHGEEQRTSCLLSRQLHVHEPRQVLGAAELLRCGEPHSATAGAPIPPCHFCLSRCAKRTKQIESKDQRC